MLGAGLQINRGRGEDRFYNPVKARRNHYRQNQNQHQQNNQNENLEHKQIQKGRSNGSDGTTKTTARSTTSKGKSVIIETPTATTTTELENRAGSEERSKAVAVPASEPVIVPSVASNLDRFLESITPSVPVQYLSTTRMRGLRTCDVEYQPYFMLSDLWESFKEWSAYGAGVPLILNDNDSVVQYYVPYLSGIQLYGESTRSPKTRRPGEDSDGDYYRDSSSDGSSDCELDRRLKFSKEQWSPYLTSDMPIRMDRHSLRDNRVAPQEGFSSDDGEAGTSRGLLFEFLECDPPYSREPLADKISALARCFAELKKLRSCDLLPVSWISVAWYPIYRIPTGPTLKDLDACFLSFHSLSTPMRGNGNADSPIVTYPNGMDGVHKISLPAFGMASYKLKGSIWIPSGVSSECQLSSPLLLAADSWLRRLGVNHPDFQFFNSHGTFRR